MRVLVLAIPFFIKSWGVWASELESSSARGDVDNVINRRVELPRERGFYSRNQGEMILPDQRQWPSLRKGCEPLELREILARGTGREFIATEWLRKNAQQCAKTDLIYVAHNVQNWSDFAMYDAIRLAHHYA